MSIVPNEVKSTVNICSCDGAIGVDEVSFPVSIGKSGSWVNTNAGGEVV